MAMIRGMGWKAGEGIGRTFKQYASSSSSSSFSSFPCFSSSHSLFTHTHTQTCICTHIQYVTIHSRPYLLTHTVGRLVCILFSVNSMGYVVLCRTAYLQHILVL